MKKYAISVVALIAVLAIVAPAMAYDLNMTGSLRSRGFFDSCNSLNSDKDDSNAWYDMRLRVKPSLTVSDNLVIHGRFDVLDDVSWGDYESNRTTDWDRLWMAIKTDYGKLEVGRMTGATFGTSFMDCADHADRIKYTIAFDELIMGAVYEKGAEVDSYYTSTDSDYDKYFIFGVYKTEMITGGLLVGWYNQKGGSDIYDTMTDSQGNVYPGVTGPCGTSITDPMSNPTTFLPMVTPYDREFWLLNPYFIVKVDDLTVQGEIMYHIGKFWEFDQAQYANLNKYPTGDDAGQKLRNWDYDAWAWNLEAQYDMGPFSFQAGYAWLQGQGETDMDSDKINSIGTIGCDWEKLWILTGTNDDNIEAGAGNTCGLGGWGNLGDGPASSSLSQNGAKIFYVGAGFKPMENLALDVLYGNAKAEAPLSDDWSKDYGSEYDFTLTWDIMDNLEYKFIAAYLDAGDFWKDSTSISDLENTYSLFHQLELSF